MMVLIIGKCILFTDSIHDDKLAMFEAGKKAMAEATPADANGNASSSSSSDVTYIHQ